MVIRKGLVQHECDRVVEPIQFRLESPEDIVSGDDLKSFLQRQQQAERTHLTKAFNIPLFQAAIVYHVALVIAMRPWFPRTADEKGLPLEVVERSALKAVATDLCSEFGASYERIFNLISELVEFYSGDVIRDTSELSGDANRIDTIVEVEV